MNGFQDIDLEWYGRIYPIKSHRVMGAIARIEDFITLPELKVYLQRGAIPLAKLSMVLGALLRYAGADVRDEEVYEKALSATDEVSVLTTVVNVMKLMIPQSERARLEANGDAGAELEVQGNDLGNSQATAAAS
jgi:hypothetical protein